MAEAPEPGCRLLGHGPSPPSLPVSSLSLELLDLGLTLPPAIPGSTAGKPSFTGPGTLGALGPSSEPGGKFSETQEAPL